MPDVSQRPLQATAVKHEQSCQDLLVQHSVKDRMSLFQCIDNGKARSTLRGSAPLAGPLSDGL